MNVYQGHNRSVNSAIFIGDDKIATSSDDQTLKLWDLRVMRSPVATVNVNSGVNRICSLTVNTDSSNSETFLCLPLDNRDIKIYNLNGDRIARLPRTNRVGHRRLVTSLASYGSLLLSASFDKTVNCWSLDYNPPKSLISSSNSNKLMLNQNKENSSINLATNESPIIMGNNTQMLNSDQHLMSPTPSQLNAHNTQIQLSQQGSQTPLNLITNNSSVNLKSINTLSKLAERIKI